MNKSTIHSLFFWILLLSLPLFAGDNSGEVRNKKIRKALKTLPSSYQKELPKNRRPRKAVKEPTRKERRRVRREPDYNFTLNTSFGGGAILQTFIYTLLAVVVLIFLIWLINSIRNRSRDDDFEDLLKVNRIGGSDEEPAYDISAADKLAGKGELTEAIHLLYLEVINWLQKRGSLKIKKSLTNREILRASSLTFEKTRTLGSFISIVEELYFGDLPATMEHYNQSKTYAEAIMGRGDA